MDSGAAQSDEAFIVIFFTSPKLHCENSLCFSEYQEIWLHSNAPRSATELQHHTANSNWAFLLPPDVLEAAGLCQGCNILHPVHLWFQFVTGSKVFLKEPPTEALGWVIVLLFVFFFSAAARILCQLDKLGIYWALRRCSTGAQGKDCYQCTYVTRAR